MLRVIKLLLYYFAYNLGVTAVVTGIWMAFNGFQFPTESGAATELSIYVLILANIAYGLHLVWGRYCELNHTTLSPVSVSVMTVSVVLILAMGCWSNYMLEALEVPDTMKELFEVMLDNPWGIFAIALLAPVFEEILFRGAIQGYLMKKWTNPWWGIVVASLIFGTIHGNPVQIPFAFITGLVLGWVYYRTGSLLPGIVMHFVNNSFSVVLFHFTRNEADTTMVGLLGETGAVTLAVIGFAVTIACVWYIAKKEVL